MFHSNKVKIQTTNIKERYLFISKTTKHVTQIFPLNWVSSAKTKYKVLEAKKKKVDLSFFEQRKTRRKSAYLLEKTKILQKKSQNRLF